MSTPTDFTNIPVSGPHYTTTTTTTTTSSPASFLGLSHSGTENHSSHPPPLNPASHDQLFHGSNPGVGAMGGSTGIGGGGAGNGAAIDPNSPEVFKGNILLVKDLVVRVQNLANGALIGIQNAYASGSNPAQISADLANLKQALDLLCERMTQTGVGALPLLSSPSSSGYSPAAGGDLSGTSTNFFSPPSSLSSSSLPSGMQMHMSGSNVGMGVTALTENELLETTTRSVEMLFAELKRRQDMAFNIGNLLASSRDRR